MRTDLTTARRAALTAVVLGCAVLLTSCSNGLQPISGRLLKNGQPLKVSDKGLVQLSFETPENPDGRFFAVVGPDGHFTVEGPTKQGVPVGSYRARVEQLDPYQGGPDLLKGAFASSKSPIVIVADGRTEVVIDLADYAKK